MLVSILSHASSSLVTVAIPTEGIVLPSTNDPSGLNRLLSIYLPPAYDQDDTDTRYPVIYFLPGLGGDETSSALSIQSLFDTLLAEQAVVPCIIVTIGGDVDNGIPTFGGIKQGCWYVNSTLNGAFEDFITQNIIPFIDGTFNTKSSADARAIMGHSMGAYGSFYLGMRHPDIFTAWAAASPTAFWLLFSELANPNGYPEFLLNSWVQLEIPIVGPFAGKIYPTNGELTGFFYSAAGALSPNLTPANPFLAANNLRVDVPFLIDNTGAPILTGPGVFPVTNPFTGAILPPLTFSMQFDPAVVAQWGTKDPYLLAPSYYPTLQYQAIYMDGGNIELADAVAAHYLSEQFGLNNVDHEYFLYQGNHTTCLTPNICSRYKTIFQICSAQFSQGPVPVALQTTRLMGVGSITLSGNSVWLINDGTFIGLETDPLITPITNITITLEDNAQMRIGDDTTVGGSFHVGNPWSKPRITLQPALAAHTIDTTVVINGPDALLQIGTGGFLGLGCVLRGKQPAQTQYWGVSSTTNAVSATLDIQQGTFSHQMIGSGIDNNTAVLAIGALTTLTWNCAASSRTQHGGANMVYMPNARIQHPLFLDRANTRVGDGIRGFPDNTSPAYDNFFKATKGRIDMFGGAYNNSVTRAITQASFEPYATTIVPPASSGSPLTVFNTRSMTAAPQQPVQYAQIGPRAAGSIYVYLINNEVRRGTSTAITTEDPIEYPTVARDDGIIGVWIEPTPTILNATEAYAFEGLS